jgi:hypothetical protein
MPKKFKPQHQNACPYYLHYFSPRYQQACIQTNHHQLARMPSHHEINNPQKPYFSDFKQMKHSDVFKLEKKMLEREPTSQNLASSA